MPPCWWRHRELIVTMTFVRTIDVLSIYGSSTRSANKAVMLILCCSQVTWALRGSSVPSSVHDQSRCANPARWLRSLTCRSVSIPGLRGLRFPVRQQLRLRYGGGRRLRITSDWLRHVLANGSDGRCAVVCYISATVTRTDAVRLGSRQRWQFLVTSTDWSPRDPYSTIILSWYFFYKSIEQTLERLLSRYLRGKSWLAKLAVTFTRTVCRIL